MTKTSYPKYEITEGPKFKNVFLLSSLNEKLRISRVFNDTEIM